MTGDVRRFDCEPVPGEDTKMTNAIMHRIVLNTVILSLGLHLGGCTAVLHNAVVSSYPTFEETERSWPPLPADHGRVVVFWPRLPAQGFTPLPTMGGFGTVQLTIDSDSSKSTTVRDQTFVFADLSAGPHVFEVNPGGLFWKKHTVTVNVEAGQITFLKIETTQLTDFVLPRRSLSSAGYHTAARGNLVMNSYDKGGRYD